MSVHGLLLNNPSADNLIGLYLPINDPDLFQFKIFFFLNSLICCLILIV